VQNSNDIITVLDEKGIQTSVSGPIERILGYRSGELVGTSGFGLMHPDDLESAMNAFSEVTMYPGTAKRLEFRYRHKNGTWVVLEAVGTNLLADPVVNGIVMNSRDISERKKLQEQLQQAMKMEAVGLLAGGIAHDFNNLLNVINGYCELVLEDIAADDPKRKDLEQITQAGLRAASLTSQLLAFGRKQILQPEILDLNSVINGMSSMLRRLIRENIELIPITQPGLGLINADPGQIQQIIMNLAVNSRDAILEGGNLTIETANVNFDEEYAREHPAIEVGPYVMLAISDNGLGMDAVTKSHLFEPFFTTKEKGKGTGLGLSTVYGIVKQSNGFIWVYSEPGKGTTFKIYFPRAEGKVPRIIQEGKTVQEDRGSETILVTEDESSVRALVARILRERGYTVLEASKGKEALDIAEKYSGEINLLITDVVMPGMGGKALESQLTAIRPSLKALFISGYTDNAIVHHGILDSDVVFLQKPFTVESLTRKVRAVLDS
jgi:PAS domain S-box-containing protein